MAARDVQPDENLLEQIFETELPTRISIILQNWDKCIFRADYPDTQPSYVVRLEATKDGDAASETFPAIAAMQEIARTVIPELVPRTYKTGMATNAENRNFNFSVIELVEGELLEDVWEEVGSEDQASIVAELSNAVSELHSVRMSDLELNCNFQAWPTQITRFRKGFNGRAFWRSSTGFMESGDALLNAIMERRKLKKAFCTIETPDGTQSVRIESIYGDLGSVVVNKSDVTKWPEEAVFCHNDLTPRNIIIRSSVDPNGETRYKLAGLIDWELAGFYAASYELSLQDTYLSGANRHISFYLLLKEQLARLVPRSSSQIMLVRAMEIIWESQQQALKEGNNIPAHIRKRFLETGGLVRDEDPYVEWRRKEGQAVELDSAAAQDLENEVVEK